MNRIITSVISALLAIVMVNAASGMPPGKKHGAGHEGTRPVTALTCGQEPGRDMRHMLAVPSQRKFGCSSRQARKVATGVVATPSDLCGSVTYDNLSTKGVKIVPQTPEGEFVMIAPDIVANRGAVMVDGVYYVARSEGYLDYTYYIDSYDADSWELIESRQTTVEMMSSDMALDPVSGKVYGCFFASFDDITGRGTYAFGSVDFNSLTMTPIRVLDDKFYSAVAFDADGTLYVVDNEGFLSVIDKATGETLRDVGSTGLTPFYTTGGIIEPQTGRFFYSFANYYGGALYEINKATAEATLLVNFPNEENVAGLFFPPSPAADGAPAQATDLRADFVDAALSGEVVFSAPSLTYGGAALSGELTYEVLADKEVLASGKVTAGQSESAHVELSAPGEYEFVVVLANEAGQSPKAKVRAWVGNDTPLSPEIVAFERVGESFRLSWEPVVAGVHGGYVDAAAMTYRVVRYPDEVTVADGLKATSVEDIVAQPDNFTAYHYTVAASASGLESAPASTSVIALGEIHPPYFPTFMEENPLMHYTIIDGNDDGKSWDAYKWNETTVALRLMYNTSKSLDDWLITPPIAMEGGKSYKVAFNTYCADPYSPEKLEVKWGSSPTVEGMTNTLMPPTEITAPRREPLHFEEYVTPEESGTYYIGFHGISDAYMYYLYVQDFEIAAGMGSGEVAAAVGSFNVTPDPAGELKAVVSMVAPKVDTGGNELAELEKIEVYRNLVCVHTFNAPKPGDELAFTDEVDSKGVYTYRAIPYTKAGAGVPSEDVSRYLGINIPGKVENLAGVETDGDGMVTVSWNPPSVDVSGNLIVPGIITYTLVDISNPDVPETLLENTKELSYSYRAIAPGSRQTLVQWQVTAHTEAGSGANAKSLFVPVGVPYETPFVESFYGGGVSSVVYTNNVAGRGMWDLFDDSYGIAASDGDRGYAGMVGTSAGDAAALSMGKIMVPQSNPGIWFQAYNINTGVANENTIEVEANAGSGWEPVGMVVMKDLPVTSAWNRVTMKLDKYAGKPVQFRFIGTTRTYTNTLIDNVNVGILPDIDLAAEQISVPAKALAGKPFGISVTIGNYGAHDADGYKVSLFRNGDMVASVDGVAVASGMRATVAFEDCLNAMADKTSEYYAEVLSADDDNESNDLSPKASVELELPNLPTVGDLKGADNGGAVLLEWSEPDMSAMLPDAVTESFEDAEPFAIDNVEGWTFIDADKTVTYTLSGKTFPNQGLEMAYIVFDDTHEFADEYLMANTGHKYLACMAAKLVAPEHNDDWLISPALCGAAQQVSFFAKSYTTQYGYELIEVYYSLGGKDVDDFVKADGVPTIEVPDAWTRYEFAVPEGARYFAIRCVSSDCCALMIDDISYIPDAALPELEIKGYNVYRDGTKLNEALLTDKTYSDNAGGDGPHRYGVTVVYDRGESAVSNIVDVALSGVENVLYNGVFDRDNTVYDVRGIRMLENATPQQVASLPAGVYIYNGKKIVVK